MEKANTLNFIGKYVIVRWHDAWVRCGKLLDDTPWHIVLEDARMLYRWWAKEGIGLSGVASHWLADREEVKILETLKSVIITDNRVSTFFECSAKVEEELRARKTAQQS